MLFPLRRLRETARPSRGIQSARAPARFLRPPCRPSRLRSVIEPSGAGDGRPPEAIAVGNIDEPAALQGPSRGTQRNVLGSAEVGALADAA
jgi:hypothetical protein